jgi:hypothetical protein
MNERDFPEREALKWSPLSIWLWIAVGYLLLLYVALRWGGPAVMDALP